MPPVPVPVSVSVPDRVGWPVSTKGGDKPAPTKELQACRMTQVPLFTLFALKALLGCRATYSNNVKGGTILPEARSAKKHLW
jgi:hypothetical protein